MHFLHKIFSYLILKYVVHIVTIAFWKVNTAMQKDL